MEDIYNGLNLFEKLFSSSYKGPVDQHQKDMHFQAISLLQNLSDMLALKVEEERLSISLFDLFYNPVTGVVDLVYSRAIITYSTVFIVYSWILPLHAT